MNTLIEKIVWKGHLPFPKRWFEIVAYYALPAILLLLSLVPGVREGLHEGLGSIAQAFIIGILFVTPLSVFLPRFGFLRMLMGLRREFGIATFYMGFFHFFTTYPLSVGALVDGLTSSLSSISAYWFGAVALLIMGVLWLTSNRVSQKTLGPWWKRLQRLAYVLLPFVLIHSALMEGEGVFSAIGITLAFIAMKVAAYFVKQQRKAARQRLKQRQS